jgi:flagellar biosynthetic protein FliQ
MTVDFVMGMVSNLLWTGLIIAAPLLLSTLVVGVLVSVFQAITQIQEMSLAFIPKIIAVVVVLMVMGPWMLRHLLTYSAALIGGIPDHF